MSVQPQVTTRRGLTTVGAILVALLVCGLVGTPPARAATTGLRVADGRLVEANGRDLVLRGINHAYTWYPGRTGTFAAIKAAGANSIRLSLAIGRRWKPASTAADLAAAVALCKQNRLICVLDAHDTMGYGQQAGAASMDQAVDYWLAVRSALVGQENYVILNIADEPFGYKRDMTWTRDTMRAIGRLRAAGFRHTLMVDGPDWGQDEFFTMRDNAPKVLASDPARNVLFDVHMYGVFHTPAKVRAYLQSFVDRRLPLVVGEFSDNHPYGKPAVDAILAYCQRYRLGFLGWSWSGNTEAAYLDMVRDFDPALRTPWGVRFLSGVNGLQANAREASVFGADGAGAPDGTAPRGRWTWPDLWSWSLARATAVRAFPAWPASPAAAGVSPSAPHLAAAVKPGDTVTRTGDVATRPAAVRVTPRRAAWAFAPR
ncbi:cellulase family glycosylhydrolase [Planosporangium sp. 12N6]|uniref:cellulase family glycosylhydrolase n=1 Tax=Planosporangium spinosum TaxID=3402278 RepID=UPI003CF048B4